jgi:hypothetical protein
MIKKLFTTILLALIAIFSNAQTPDWIWASGAGGTANDIGRRTTSDGFGNTYVMGWFKSPSITFGSITLTNQGGQDIFIVKYDITGNVIWAQGIGGIDDDYAYGSTCDALGNFYITGRYGYSINLGTITLTYSSSANFFAVKYDAIGNVVWAQGCNGAYTGHSISADAFGNIYATGIYGVASITFGTTTLINTNQSYDDVFIVKYDEMGNVLWAKGFGGTKYDVSGGSTVDNYGNLYVTGAYYSPSISLGTITLTNADSLTTSGDIFVLKYDSLGNLLWAQGIGNINTDYGQDINTDATGQVYVTGQFNSQYINLGTTTLTNAGYTGISTDIFVVKFDTSGNVLWAKGIGETAEQYGYSSIDSSGNLYLACRSSSPSITFGPFTLTNINAGYYDVYVVKYDSAGNEVWVKGVGGTANDIVNGISNDIFGNICITGYYDSPFINFGTTTITNSGNIDLFVTKLGASLVSNHEKHTVNETIIYPNPSNGIFILNKNIKTVEVFNMMGELVLIENNTNQINLQAFPKGLYAVRINGFQVSSLVKE